MTTLKKNLILYALILFATGANAQIFNCGSSGALGDVVISTNTTWDVPDNGRFDLNSLLVETNATLSFRKPVSGMNPPVYLLSRSNVVIYGVISVNGQDCAAGLVRPPGGPGGFDGGSPGFSGVPPGLWPGTWRGCCLWQ